MIFEAGYEMREKISIDFGAEQNVRAERKESGFCSYRCFWERESEKLMCKKISLSERNFFAHVRLLKAVFTTFDGYEVWLWYCISFNFVLSLTEIEGFK